MSLEPPVEHKQVIIRAEVDRWFGKPRKYKWWELLASKYLGWHYADEGGEFHSWLVDLIEVQDMKIMDGPHIAYCERPGLEGWSGTAIIETSHVAIHVWDKVSPVLVQLDFYTCGQLDVDLVIEQLVQFGLQKHDQIVLDREYRLEVL